MARALALTTFALLLAVVAFATPTTPVIRNAYDLPWWYLEEDSDTGKITVSRNLTHGKKLKAQAQWNESLADLGWDYLNIVGDGEWFSGYLEGFLTAQRIQLMGVPGELTGKTGAWVSEHLDYMRRKSESERKFDEFWAMVGDQLSMVDGLAAGTNAVLGTNYTAQQMFLMSFGPELGDVQSAISVQQSKKAAGFRQNWKPSHCSALIKVTADDLYMAHDTWDVMEGMAYRVYKVYNFHGVEVAFSSHPGDLSSTDDWYITSKQLAIQETTNGVMNMSLYTMVVPHTVSEWLRVMAATFLADNGADWTTYFARENSGTYNNQYMVVDFKKYSPGSSIIPGTLWIAEQLPGLIVRGDESAVLAATGYWASYNIPYYKQIYDLSGYQVDLEEYGLFYSYTKYARPLIFKRNQTSIHTREHMMQMLRYNGYQTDPFSAITNCTGAPDNKCLTPQSSMMSIASRGDLMPLYNTTQEMVDHYGPLHFFMAQGCFGAIDTKVAAWSARHSMQSWIISGPSNDQQPTFAWEQGACQGHPAPKGTPTVVDYPWVQFNIRRPSW